MKKYAYILLILASVSTMATAQIKIGNYSFKDGSEYTGELKGRKPNGKGKTVFKNGDIYEGQYVKENAKVTEPIRFTTERNMWGSGIRTSSMATVLSIL